MRRRLMAVFLSAALTLTLIALPAAAGELTNFQKVATYSNSFADVAAEAWFAQSVRTAYELGLMGGKSATAFDPASNLTMGEGAKLAATLHSIYETGSASFPAGTPWYQPYVDYLTANSLLTQQVSDWTAKATRGQFAMLLAASLPEEALTSINEIAEGSIPDVTTSAPYHNAVYTLYRAGILTGSDSRGSFKPTTNIQRSEVAAIVTRMADINQRKSVTLAPAMTAQEVFAQCSPAVGYIELYNAAGKLIATGSGFFISADGKLVTNHHVIEGAASATVKTPDGKTHKILGVYDASEALDLALLQVEGSGFPFLTLGDSQAITTGASVFAIGSPLGLENSLSTGIVSSPSRQVNGATYIQITAPISSGSSGGALLDDGGRVIGVTTGSLVDGQSLNLAVPIHLLANLKTGAYQALSAVSTPSSTPAPGGTVSLTTTPASVTMKVGETVTVTYYVNDPSQVATNSRATVADPSILDFDFGAWEGDDFPLYLTGLKAGTTTLTLLLYDDNDKPLTSHTLTVTVTGTSASSTIPSYAGWAPAPDFGAFASTSLFMDSGDSDGHLFLYRIDDLNVDSKTAVTGYFTLLEQLGFVYAQSFVDEEGYDVLIFDHTAQNVTLMYSLRLFSGIPCITIFLTH